MLLLAHRFIRGAVLACMIILAGTACCSSDSYDPDPYDDTPPVVTVEFNYVVPPRVNIRGPQSQSKRQLNLYSRKSTQPLLAANLAEFSASLVHGLRLRGPSHSATPLRC